MSQVKMGSSEFHNSQLRVKILLNIDIVYSRIIKTNYYGNTVVDNDSVLSD